MVYPHQDYAPKIKAFALVKMLELSQAFVFTQQFKSHWEGKHFSGRCHGQENPTEKEILDQQLWRFRTFNGQITSYFEGQIKLVAT